MSYLELKKLKTHLIEKIGFWMGQTGRAARVAEYRAELARVETLIAAELAGDVILN